MQIRPFDIVALRISRRKTSVRVEVEVESRLVTDVNEEQEDTPDI